MIDYFVEYKHKYLKMLKEEYKKGNRLQKREIKEIIYRDPYLTEKQKDKIWSTLIRTNGK